MVQAPPPPPPFGGDAIKNNRYYMNLIASDIPALDEMVNHCINFTDGFGVWKPIGGIQVSHPNQAGIYHFIQTMTRQWV